MTDAAQGDNAPAPCIYETHQFRDQNGHNIIENRLVHGDRLPDGLSRFMGQVFIEVRQGPHAQTVPVPPFPVEADSIERAFAVFPGLAMAAAQAFKDTLTRRPVHTPSPDEARRILGSDGRYL